MCIERFSSERLGVENRNRGKLDFYSNLYALLFMQRYFSLFFSGYFNMMKPADTS